MITHMALFAGMGGFMTAAQRQSMTTIFANELNICAVSTLKENFKNTLVSSLDIRDLDPTQIAELNAGIDILSAGFPCQSFSQAGNNLGFEDERGRLFFEITRIIKQMNKPPKVIVLENVPFLKNFDDGSRYNVVINDLRKAGYWVGEPSTKVLDAYDYSNSHQRRERLFIVAVHSQYFGKNKFIFPSPIKIKKKNIWRFIDRNKKGPNHTYIKSGNKYEQMIRRKADEKGSDRLFQIRRTEARACPTNTCPTLTANMGTGGHNVPFLIDSFGIRRLSINECMALQGYRTNEVKFPAHTLETDQLSMVGNAVCVDVIEQLFISIRNTVLGEYEKEHQVAFS
jgi:DNA (cytosine-5)-methyltransferase 1